MKTILKLISAILFAFILSPLTQSTAQSVGSNLTTGESVLAVLGVQAGATIIMHMAPANGMVLNDTVVLTEMWERGVLEKLRFMGNFYDYLLPKDNWVNNNVINLADAGADPEVLINNNVYPIAVNPRLDLPIALALNKYETTNTAVTDAELYARSYDKIASVVDQHGNVLQEQMRAHALWAISPAANNTASSSFVIKTTGANVAADSRKRLLRADIYRLARLMDDAKIPRQGRHLVLCGKHTEDLLLEDVTLMNQVTSAQTGSPASMIAGFVIHFDVYTPSYTLVAGAPNKKAYGAAPAGTDKASSIAFHSLRAWKAAGSTKMYYGAAETDPQNRQTVVGFTQYGAGGLLKLEGSGAIVDEVNS